MTKQKMKWNSLRGPLRRLTALFLATVLVIGLMYIETPKAEAVSWAQGYLDTLVSWGVMRGDIDGNLNPDREITRAEFVTLINRAYGYSDVANTPFTDVYVDDWYYEDIGIAYGTGYFSGTSATTASPTDTLTREQAVVLLGRNMRLEEATGEAVSFNDSREFSAWSRGMIEASANYGIVNGFEDGSFQPTRNITRGEVAALLTRALGNLVNKEGTTSLGDVYGNVTISSTGVTLKDSIIAGDLYLTGGVGLGNVMLENVKVLGKIIVSGAGESHEGDRSIVLRNTTSDNMTVDSITGQLVTISADGDTKVGTTTVKTLAYLEDLTGKGFGLDQINFNGASGSTLQIAGNIKSVKNLTAGSTITLAQGTAAEVTIDEYARDSTLRVESGAWVQKLNLDTGAKVTGSGDIDELVVNSDGSTIEIIPDEVNVRPGVSTSVGDETMDSSIAAEFSQAPRLLAGYPQVKNIAPTTADAVFSTNKSGTVYWAVSAVSDGSVSEADLINPPSYGGLALLSGSTAMLASSAEASVALTRLTTGGSYYLSAVFVDSRGQRGPVKVVSFTTPDDTVPAFATGYPYMSRITNIAGQVAVMTTKSCQLYYALLPQNSTAPTVADFKANAVAGNLGFGTMEVTKNSPSLFYVNGKALEELESYDLYLWLTDFNGAKSSTVRKLTFRTVDMTPPEFLTEPTVNSIRETAIGLQAAINEQGTIYWAVVKEGTEYPKPLAGQTVNPALNSDTAKLQVSSGMNCLKSGKVSARASTEVTINVTGLEAEKAYDFYYLAQDAAGNYSEWVKMITIHTLDNKPPTVTQEFTLTADEAGNNPLPNTDVKVIFSESIQHNERNNYQTYYKLYQIINDTSKSDTEKDDAKKALLEVLNTDIRLMDASVSPAKPVEVLDAPDASKTNWVCYDKLEISMEDGQAVFLFENGKNISLSSGGTYYFQLANISDTSDNMNAMPANAMRLPTFKTVFAQVALKNGVSSTEITKADKTSASVHMSFTMTPLSTESVADNIFYDTLLWSDTMVEFNLYGRVLEGTTLVTAQDGLMKERAKAENTSDEGWVFLGEAKIVDTDIGVSVQQLVNGRGSTVMPKLNEMKEAYTYEFAIELTRVKGLYEENSWSDAVTITVGLPAGDTSNVNNLSRDPKKVNWRVAISGTDPNQTVTPIGEPENFSVYRRFQDTAVPKFAGDYPTFIAGDSSVTMRLQLNRSGTVYYVIAPVMSVEDEDGNKGTYNETPYLYAPSIETTDASGRIYPNPEDERIDEAKLDVPEGASSKTPRLSGKDYDKEGLVLTAPGDLNIYSPKYSNSQIKTGNVYIEDGVAEVTVGNEAGKRLLTMTTYYVYMVLKGTSQSLSEVYCFQFTTGPVGTPIITLNNLSPSVKFTTSTDAVLDYILIPYSDGQTLTLLTQKFEGNLIDEKAVTDEIKTLMGMSANMSGDGNSDTFSVLDALLTSTSTGESVFDICASKTGSIRKDVADYIRGSGDFSANTPTSMGSINNMTAGDAGSQPRNFATAMSASQNGSSNTTVAMFYCLAVAHNAQGTVDGFKAINGIQNVDTVAPEFKNVITTVTDYWQYGQWQGSRPSWNTTENIEEQRAKLSAYTYSGTLTITFSKPIYFIATSGSNRVRREVWVAGAETEDNNKSNGIYFHNHVTDPSGILTYATGTKQQGVLNTITVKFTNASIGDTLIIFSDGNFSNSSSISSGKQLTLRLTALPEEGRMNTESKMPTLISQAVGFTYTWS